MQSRNISIPKKQQGFTLIEIVIAIAVAAILLGGFIAYGSSTKDSARATKTVDVIRQISTAATTWGQSKSSYGSVSLSALQTGGYLATNVSANPYGGAFTVSGSGTTVTITSAGMTTNGCAQAIDLLTNDASSTPTCTSGTLSFSFGG